MGKTIQRADALVVASTYQAIKKQAESDKTIAKNNTLQKTIFKVLKNVFSPDKRLQKRSFFRNILKL